MRAETTPVSPTHVDLPVSGALASSIPARAWRAIAGGAPACCPFDHGEPFGTGTTGRGGQGRRHRRGSLLQSRNGALQLSANARLVDQLRPGPPITIEPSVSGVEVVLLDGGASWDLVATNTGAGTQKTEGAPSATARRTRSGSAGSMARTLAMLNTPQGPRWTFEIAAGKALVYIIGKVQR